MILKDAASCLFSAIFLLSSPVYGQADEREYRLYPAEAVRHYDTSQRLGAPADPKLGRLLEALRYKERTLACEPLPGQAGQPTILRIRGNPQGDETLLKDTVRSIKSRRGVSEKESFDTVDVELVMRKTDAPVWVAFKLADDGGADFIVSESQDILDRL